MMFATSSSSSRSLHRFAIASFVRCGRDDRGARSALAGEIALHHTRSAASLLVLQRLTLLGAPVMGRGRDAGLF